jgi:hypothetical protein
MHYAQLGVLGKLEYGDLLSLGVDGRQAAVRALANRCAVAAGGIDAVFTNQFSYPIDTCIIK